MELLIIFCLKDEQRNHSLAKRLLSSSRFLSFCVSCFISDIGRLHSVFFFVRAMRDVLSTNFSRFVAILFVPWFFFILPNAKLTRFILFLFVLFCWLLHQPGNSHITFALWCFRLSSIDSLYSHLKRLLLVFIRLFYSFQPFLPMVWWSSFNQSN